MTFIKASFLILVVSALGTAQTADDDDHSNHCHIDGFPSIHVNIGESFELPGACIKLLCKTYDLFEVIGTCEQLQPGSSENVDFANQLLAGKKCPKGSNKKKGRH